jgi:hypothetical protein
LQVAAADRPDDAGHDARFQIIVQDMSGRESQPALAGQRRPRIVALEAVHVPRRIRRPAHAADIRVEMGVAVADDIQAGEFLLLQIDHDRVGILIAELIGHHRVEEMPVPRFSVYQAGRGSDPVIVVGSMMSLVALSMVENSSADRLTLDASLPAIIRCGTSSA